MHHARPLIHFEPPTLSITRPFAELRRLPVFVDLFLTLCAHRIRVRYKQSRLGILWAVLQPLSMTFVFTAMLSFIGGAPAQGVPYPLFAYAALLPWTGFSSGLSASAGALTAHASLLTKVSFPREILPLTYVVAALVDLAIASTALAALMIWYQVAATPHLAWTIVAIALLSALLVGLGLLVSAVQVRYRDVGLAMPVVLQIWLFASPILYPLSAVRRVLPEWLYVVYLLNPMVGVVETFRRASVLRQAPDFEALATSAFVTFAILPIAYVYFKWSEYTMADVV